MERIQLIIGSARPNRFADKPARWVADELAARGDLDVELVDLRDYPLPFFEEPAPPAYTLREYPDPTIARWGRKVDEADGFVFVVAEYNHGYTAFLKNALDHLFPEWHRKPVSFVGYGNIGGGRGIVRARGPRRGPESRSRSSATATSAAAGRSSSSARSWSSSRWRRCATRSTFCQ